MYSNVVLVGKLIKFEARETTLANMMTFIAFFLVILMCGSRGLHSSWKKKVIKFEVGS